MPHDFDELATEARTASADDYDLRPTRELVDLMNREDALVPTAVRAAGERIAALIDVCVERLAGGGRLIYVGAGSSGRIAALDASECEATFSTTPGHVLALVAGEHTSSSLEELAAEDDEEAGASAVHAAGVTAADVVVGISASGRTPYVVGALGAAREAGALTACVVSVPDSQLAALAQHEITVPVGPEFIAGSTRLKAGTAQKLVLNMLSTIAMIRLGKTFGNLMVDVSAGNEKLRARVHRIVQTATGASPARADEALAAADGDAKVAIVSLLAGIDPERARERLAAANGNIRAAVRG